MAIRADGIEGLYIISVAARLLAMHPQTLRKYERAGLIQPTRTIGMLRLYSAADIARLRLIKRLVDAGLNIAGLDLVLDLVRQLDELRDMAADHVDARRACTRIADRIDQVLATLGLGS